MKFKDWIVATATFALVAVVIVMMGVFVVAVLDPTVDDKIVFDIIGPAFQTIVGGFIGLITGINLGSKNNDEAN
jgi:hypothetical protein